MSTILDKTSRETARYQIDCTDFLGSTELVTSITSVTAEPITTPPLAFSALTVNASPVAFEDRTAAVGKVLQLTISGGVTGTVYVIRPLIVTSVNSALEPNVLLQIIDTP